MNARLVVDMGNLSSPPFPPYFEHRSNTTFMKSWK